MWDELLVFGIIFVGFGVCDMLWLEVGFLLYGYEFGDDIYLLSSYYSWVVKDKEYYGCVGL